MTKRGKVSFFIGRYRDEVYSDVVDMDAYHLLFGRPSQFDVDAQHSRRNNTYQIKKEGSSLTYYH